MRKLLLAFLILALPCSAFAGGGATMMMVGGNSGTADNTSFFDGFTTALDNTVWGTVTAGSGTVAVDNNTYLVMTGTGTDAGFAYLKSPWTYTRGTTVTYKARAFNTSGSPDNLNPMGWFQKSGTPVADNGATVNPTIRLLFEVYGWSNWPTTPAVGYWNIIRTSPGGTIEYWKASDNTWNTGCAPGCGPQISTNGFELADKVFVINFTATQVRARVMNADETLTYVDTGLFNLSVVKDDSTTNFMYFGDPYTDGRNDSIRYDWVQRQ